MNIIEYIHQLRGTDEHNYYIPWFHITDERIGELTWQYAADTWLLYSSVNR
jgi:hypothetical protein